MGPALRSGHQFGFTQASCRRRSKRNHMSAKPLFLSPTAWLELLSGAPSFWQGVFAQLTPLGTKMSMEVFLVLSAKVSEKKRICMHISWPDRDIDDTKRAPALQVNHPRVPPVAKGNKFHQAEWVEHFDWKKTSHLGYFTGWVEVVGKFRIEMSSMESCGAIGP